jgi:lipopolysaccharide transport system ATP-binding protein
VHSRDGRAPVVAFGIARADGTAVYGVSSEMDQVRPVAESSNVYVAEIEFHDLDLLPGAYSVKAHPMDSEGVRLFDTLERGLVVRGNSRELGLVRLTHRWHDVEPARTLEVRVAQEARG